MDVQIHAKQDFLKNDEYLPEKSGYERTSLSLCGTNLAAKGVAAPKEIWLGKNGVKKRIISPGGLNKPRWD